MRPTITYWVAWLLVCHSHEPCNDSWTSWVSIWVLDLGEPKESCIRWGADPPWEAAMLTRERAALQWAVQKRLNWSRYRLGCGLVWAQASVCYMWRTLAPPGKYDWTVRELQRCGLLWNYLDHLLLMRKKIIRVPCSLKTFKSTWQLNTRMLFKKLLA